MLSFTIHGVFKESKYYCFVRYWYKVCFILYSSLKKKTEFEILKVVNLRRLLQQESVEFCILMPCEFKRLVVLFLAAFCWNVMLNFVTATDLKQ